MKIDSRLLMGGGGLLMLAVIVGYWDEVRLLTDRQVIGQFLDQFGLWGMGFYVGLLSLQVLLVVIPGHALMVTAGYLYGFQVGLLLNLLGAICASQLAFSLARYRGQPVVDRVVPALILKRWHHILHHQAAHPLRGAFFCMLCFWFPIIPSNATNYLAGLSNLSGWLFLMANVVGRLPGLILITLVGSHGVELTATQWGVIICLAVGVIVFGHYLTTKLEG